ncbi:MAG: DUF5060 domain-containing protein [Candidatus Sumerlaeia bacterium]|nr:DUF5060 domain-containing protein [Candidatus Sumerlaeia bacterium]
MNRVRFVGTMYLALVAGLICASGLFAGEPPLRAEKVAEGAYPDLAVDTAGNVHLVYVRDGALYYRKYAADRAAWGDEQPTGLPAGMVHRSDPDVAIDSTGRPHVVVGSTYGWWNGAKWEQMVPGFERDTALAIDAQDNVYICKRDGAQKGYLGLLVRKAGAPAFDVLPDPDIAGGLPRGENNHVYGHVFTGPGKNEIHIVYRHGAPPAKCAYRTSRDGGKTWAGTGITADDFEAPSGLVAPDGTIYAVSGNGSVFQRGNAPDQWQALGRAVTATRRDLPALAADSKGALYAVGFGGRINIRTDGRWVGERRLPSQSGKPIGYVEAAGGKDCALVVWEEGDKINKEEAAGTSQIYFARLRPAALAALPEVPPASPPAAEGQQAAAKQPEKKTTPKPPSKPRIEGGTQRVGLWDRFEWMLRNPRTYADPYRDVTLEATYTRPDGSTVRFWGFYDGDGFWKIRFMPDQAGTWKFEARFSDGAPGASGQFECIKSDLPGMVCVYSPNPRWFGFKGGDPVLVRSFHVGDRFFAANWPDAERKTFLDWAQAQGYNMLSIASHYLNRNAEGRGRGWDTPALWPLNPDEYARMETILDDLAARRILVFPFAGFFGQSSNYPRNPADQELYIRYTLARIGCYWNLLFNVAGPEPNVGKVWMADADVQRLGRLIRKLDVFRHPVSVHNQTGDDPYRDSDWTDYGVLQGPKTTDRKRLSAGLLKNQHPAKPLYAQETLWSGNKNHPNYSDTDIRKNAYVINMCATSFCFADNGGGDSSAGFSGSMNPADRHPKHHDIVKAVWDFFASIPFHRMTPHPELVDNGWCLADPGRMVLVYLESPGTVNVKLSGGPYKVEWINAQNTKDRRAGGTTPDGKALKTPDGGDDWLLWLVRSEK